MENTNIYICTHKDFSVPQDLKGNYTIITNGVDLKNDYPFPIIKPDNELIPMQHSYNEGVMMYDVWKKDSDSEFIGINQYRRYLQVQWYEDVKENVIPVPFNFNIYAQYAGCHNINDLLECKSIIEKYYPEFNTNVHGLYPCNMAILEHSIYNEWCAFIFGVLEIYSERKHLYTDDDVKNYIAQIFPEDKVFYQSRLHGFLMERLSTIFFNKRFADEKIRVSQIIETDVKR